MVLNNVAKFHKILIKRIRFRERTSLGMKIFTIVRWKNVYLNVMIWNTLCVVCMKGPDIS